MPPGLTLLIDAASLIYRALFAVPDTVRSPGGTPMNAAYGFLDMAARLIADRDPAFICCAADDDWRPEWRLELIGSYKEHRAEPGSAQEQAEERLAPQMPVIAELLERAGVPVLGLDGYEAEDVIGTLAERSPGTVAIVSGDRDLFQLVRDPDVFVLFPRRGVSRLDVVDEAYIEARYGIPGRAYRDFAILRGDPSDGLPGVRGIGDKLAGSLLRRYGSLEAVMEAAATTSGVVLGKVRRDLEYLERATRVVTIPTDLELPDVDLARPHRDLGPEIHELARSHGLERPVRRLVEALAGRPEQGSSAP